MLEADLIISPNRKPIPSSHQVIIIVNIIRSNIFYKTIILSRDAKGRCVAMNEEEEGLRLNRAGAKLMCMEATDKNFLGGGPQAILEMMNASCRSDAVSVC